MLPKSTLHKWIKIFSPIKGSDENISLKDYKALQKQIQELKIENEILKKRQPYSPKDGREIYELY